MSPVAEQETGPPRGRITLRHIAPKVSGQNEPGIVDPLGEGYVVLNQTLYANPLPSSTLPTSPDFHEGDYALRLGDAGEFTLSFPNRDASDGQPWRSRFSVDGHREFIEISKEGEVEFVGVITKIDAQRGMVTISGYDGMWLLNKAYEQDFQTVMAPRDFIERYTQVWSPWLSKAYVAPGEAFATLNAPSYTSTTTTTELANATWRLTASFTILEWPTAAGPQFWAALGGNFFALYTSTAGVHNVTLYSESSSKSYVLNKPLPPRINVLGLHSLALESDGRWLRAYLDGFLIAYLPRGSESKSRTKKGLAELRIEKTKEGVVSALLNTWTIRELSPFLLGGIDKGDYVLPGTATTYPYGGLHGRYYNDLAYQELEERKYTGVILTPDRDQGSQVATDRTDATINKPASPLGIGEAWFSVRWFGSVYLDLRHNAEIEIILANLLGGARLWVGKTAFGTQIIDRWEQVGPARDLKANITAAVLGSVKGWFPIILEFFMFNLLEPPNTIELKFKPLTAGWTDPGGGTITTSAQIIPSTSLSPLGCVNQRVQGSSHLDLVKSTAEAFGYQLRCEPKQLESGEFPGQVVPRLRVGRDTDEIIEADDIDKKAGVNNYTYTRDATDSATSLRAFGSGIADGKGSQIAYEAINAEDLKKSLFDIEAYTSKGDVAFTQLLQAQAEAELALRSGSWENISGEPIARERLADSFPLTGKLAAFKWLPGDGVRLWLPDVNLMDTTPRQMMQVQRRFGPEGKNATNVGFRARPKDALYALRKSIYEATRSSRAWQKQYVTIGSEWITSSTPPGEVTGDAHCPIQNNDVIVRVVVLLTTNTAAKRLDIIINGVDRTTALGGPWTQTGVDSPTIIDITPYAVPETGTLYSRMVVKMKNVEAVGTPATVVEFKVLATLMI